MYRCSLEMAGVLTDYPGKPRFTAFFPELLLPIVELGMMVELPIKGGIVFPEFDDETGVCLCASFKECPHPNKKHAGKCTEDDLEEAHDAGEGPGGRFMLVVNHVLVKPGKELIELAMYGVDLSGRRAAKSILRAGFILSMGEKTEKEEEPV